MFRNYRKALEQSEPIPDDGLNVTKAINAQIASVMDTPEQVSQVSDQITEAAADEAETNDEDVEGVDQSDEGLDNEIDNVENNTGDDSGDEPEDKPDDEVVADKADKTSEEITQAGDDTQALEAMLVKLTKSNSGLSLEEYTPALERFTEVYKRYTPKLIQHVNRYEPVVLSTESIRSVLSSIWKFIMEKLTKLKDFLVAIYQMQTSKLKKATEDIENIKKNLQKLPSKKPRKATISDTAYGSLVPKTISQSNVADISAAAGMMSFVIGKYFEHISKDYTNLRPVLNTLFNPDTEPKVVTAPDGTEQLELSAHLGVSDKTLPIFVKNQGAVHGVDVEPGDIVIHSKTIPFGVMFVAKISGTDSVVATGHTNNICRSRQMIVQDVNYSEPGPDIPVMYPPQLEIYLKTLKDYIVVMHTGEYNVKTLIKDVEHFTKQCEEAKRDFETLQKMDKPEFAAIVDFKNKKANLLMQLINFLKGFYISMCQRVMLLGNSYLANAIKYANAVCKEFQYTPEPQV